MKGAGRTVRPCSLETCNNFTALADELVDQCAVNKRKYNRIAEFSRAIKSERASSLENGGKQRRGWAAIPIGTACAINNLNQYAAYLPILTVFYGP
jgi:hypothetical protein